MTPKTIQPASAWKPQERGLYAGLEMSVYRAAPGVNRSLLDTVAHRPNDALLPGDASTDAQSFGTLFNDALLLGRREFVVRPETYPHFEKATKTNPFPEKVDKPWNGNATFCRNWESENPGALDATGPHSLQWITAALEVCDKNMAVRHLIGTCTPEVSIFGPADEAYGYALAKARPDLLKLTDEGGAIFADLKTTVKGNTRDFSREILKWGYHRQFAHIRAILHALGISPVVGFLIILEKGERPRVQVRRLAERAMDKGDFDLDDQWQLYRKCILTGSWPDFPDQLEPHQIGEIDLPDHVYPHGVEEMKGATDGGQVPAGADETEEEPEHGR